MVEDHEGTWCPQYSENGGDGKENGGGLASRVAAQTEAAAASAQLAYNDSVEGEEDSAGEEVDSGTVGPYEDMLGHSSPVALSFSPTTTATTTTAHPRQAVPQLRPPIIRSCREQAPNIHSKYHSPCASRVGHGMVAQRVADSDVTVNGQWHGDPDGCVDGGELQNLYGIV